MKFFLPLLVLTASLSAAPAPSNQLTSAEKEAGWTLLFDGQSIEHFRNYQKEDVDESWQVKDGALTLTKKGGGDLITKKSYSAFEITLDYKISKGGNSGLMFHVQESEPKPWQTGPEVQIQDNIDGHDPQKAGWLYQLYKPDPHASTPPTRSASGTLFASSSPPKNVSTG